MRKNHQKKPKENATDADGAIVSAMNLKTHTPILSFMTSAEADEAAVLDREVDAYCAAHPRSPSAVRRPRVMARGRSFVALLGTTLEDGIAGIGSSVASALRAFDLQYSNSLKSPRG